eukprot:scaffold6025_cov134-Pinguiococcus_pyrenoidosus.AAC.1
MFGVRFHPHLSEAAHALTHSLTLSSIKMSPGFCRCRNLSRDMQQMTCGEIREREPLASFRSRAKSRARSHLDVVPELAPAPVALLWLRPRPEGQAGENGRAEVANA